MIKMGVPHAKSLIDLLRTRVSVNLARELSAEQTDLTSKFVAYGGGTFGADPPQRCVKGPKAVDFPNGGNFVLALEYCKRISSITAKMNAISDYKKALDSVDDALDELQSSKSDLSTLGLLDKLRGYVTQLSDNLSAIDNAFGKGVSK